MISSLKLMSKDMSYEKIKSWVKTENGDYERVNKFKDTSYAS